MGTETERNTDIQIGKYWKDEAVCERAQPRSNVCDRTDQEWNKRNSVHALPCAALMAVYGHSL